MNHSANNTRDEFHQRMHDIRNGRKLTAEQIAYISKLSSEDKMKIILAYNEVTQMLVEVLEYI